MYNELSTTSILSLFETTKEQRKLFVNDVLTKVKEGYISPLILQLQLKSIEDIIKQVNADAEYKSILVDEAQKQDGKKFKFHNSEIEVCEVGVKYDYSNTGDAVYTSLIEKLESITAEIKQREAFLKTVPVSGMLVTDEETGETFCVYPPSKSSTTSVKVTLK